MTITRGALKGQILSLLNKTPGYQGFYDDSKMDPIIQECFDYVSTLMFFEGNGWQNVIKNVDTGTNTVSVRIPEDMTMIYHVRYLIDQIYQPLYYNDDPNAVEWTIASGQVQYPSVYRILGDQIYFNPPVAIGGVANMQIEGCVYPAMLKTDASFAEAKFNRAMTHYIKFRASSILAASVGKFNREWQTFEDQWLSAVMSCISKRIVSPKSITDFDG